MSLVCTVFKECVSAIREGILIEREDRQDKEFHFQNWLKGTSKNAIFAHRRFRIGLTIC